MEDLCLKVPLVAAKIFEYLDNKNLVKCRKINKNMKCFLDKQRFLHLRIIDNFKGNFVEFEESSMKVKEIFHNTTFEMVKEFSKIIQEFFAFR